MPPWPFFSNSSSKSRPPPVRGPHDNLDQPFGFVESQTQPEYASRETSAPILEGLDPPILPFASSPPSRSHSRSHSRSLSNTLFGSGKKKAANGGDTPTSSTVGAGDLQLDGAGSPRKQGGQSRHEESELERGTCATCGSRMKWPKIVAEYRCAACLMVNDLKPIERKTPGSRDSERLSRSGTHPSPASRSQVASLSLERTTTIIDRCVRSYLQDRKTQRLNKRARGLSSSSHQPFRDPHTSSVERANDGSHTVPETRSNADGVEENQPLEATRGLEESKEGDRSGYVVENSMDPNQSLVWAQHAIPDRPSRTPPPPPTPSHAVEKSQIARKPLPKPSRPNAEILDPEPPRDLHEEHDQMNRAHATKAIFKPLEDYIAQFYANHECLNCSFLLARPKANHAVRSEDTIRGRTRGSPPAADNPMISDSPLSELDAKTLLLGDVAENGLWWTGRDTRGSSLGRRAAHAKPVGASTDLVHSRSPLINWPEVHSWYRSIVRAGIDWRARLKDLDTTSDTDNNTVDATLGEGDDIDDVFSEARVHLQRTLLKAAEVILKRPGRPLTSPSDTRFLLILLANPLLYPSSSSPFLLSLARDSLPIERPQTQSSSKHVRSRSSKAVIGGFWEQGHAFGIIKRALGLMSNLSNECHRYLTGWFSRYDEIFFRQLLTMIQGFVTHRLGRRHRRKLSIGEATASELIPNLTASGVGGSAQLHAALEHIDLGSKPKTPADGKGGPPPYSDDWQLKAAARVMALLFAANRSFQGKRQPGSADKVSDPTSISRNNMRHHGQLLSTSEFYNLKADYIDIAADFNSWESAQNKFSFCQYPFLLSVGIKIRILEVDVQRQMEVSAREAFFDTLFKNKALEQYLFLKVRRECLIEDSLTAVDEAVAQGPRETKKALKVQFVDEPGVDAGGLKKEWFLLLVREIFDPLHGMFIYDDDSHFCYFNPHSFETSNQYFLVGALLGFAIYNLTILDIAFPPFLFKKLLASSTGSQGASFAFNRGQLNHCTLDDLSEYRPSLARGLRQLLEYDGDVQETFCRDFVIEVDRYGGKEQVFLCSNAANTPVTNSNRQEFVDLYVRYLLDTQVSRQFEPFKRGFLQVCGGNALSLFQPEEIELLIRGSDEPLDVRMLKAVAVYENWGRGDRKVDNPAEDVDLVKWFWEFFEEANPGDQRKLLSFITGSDRIPATGAANLVIKIGFAGKDYARFPIARTCFNSLLLYRYRSKEELVERLWRAVCESEGFGLK